jgi:excisionase family DNA binding protein
MTDPISKALAEVLRPVILEAVREALAELDRTENPESLLKTSETCDRLAISRTTLHEMRKRGEIEAVRVNGGVRFRASDVDELVHKRVTLT